MLDISAYNLVSRSTVRFDYSAVAGWKSLRHETAKQSNSYSVGFNALNF